MRTTQVPSDYAGSFPGADKVERARWNRDPAKVERSRQSLEELEAKLLRHGLAVDGHPCRIALRVVAAHMRHSDKPLTVGLIRRVANERRAELDLPLIPTLDKEVA
ncbi:MAG TPA: hypothetical protein VM493_07910 [Vicinamibacterales bacterium]|nr:hypothetical protein [Vicinamibacterales bacterium]